MKISKINQQLINDIYWVTEWVKLFFTCRTNVKHHIHFYIKFDANCLTFRKWDTRHVKYISWTLISAFTNKTNQLMISWLWPAVCQYHLPSAHFTNSSGAYSWNLWKWNFFLCSNFDSNNYIRSQFCTCHEHLAVVACVKLWLHLPLIFCVTATWIFYDMWVMSF